MRLIMRRLRQSLVMLAASASQGRIPVLAVMTCAAIIAPIAAQQQGPDRSKAPALGPAPALKLPPIQKKTLSNGLPVWFVEMHKVPVVDVTLIVRAGASNDPAAAFGVAAITADMLDEGAGGKTALELADAIDYLGASISTGSSYDASTVRLHVPVARVDAALPLMSDIALRPAFAASELERIRKVRLNALLQAKDNAGAIASIAFSRVLYGARNRYGTGTGGTESTVGEISVKDLQAFYGTYYRAINSTLIVVGDVNPAQMLPKLEAQFGSWPKSTEALTFSPPRAPQHGPRQIYLVDKPAAAQSQIRIGWIGVPRSTPDFPALTVLNTILGGSFTSRLNQNLREQHGYAYGAGSSFDMRLGAGPFSASAGVQTDKTVESLREFFKELDGMHELIPADELNREKNLVVLSYPGDFETTTGVASRLAPLVIYGLPESSLTDFVPKVQAVTAADLQRAAVQYLQTDKFAVVVVGDLATIEKPIRAANLGPVTVLTMDQLVK
jgi:predicted Zn-dependent peptidase